MHAPDKKQPGLAQGLDFCSMQLFMRNPKLRRKKCKITEPERKTQESTYLRIPVYMYKYYSTLSIYLFGVAVCKGPYGRR